MVEERKCKNPQLLYFRIAQSVNYREATYRHVESENDQGKTWERLMIFKFKRVSRQDVNLVQPRPEIREIATSRRKRDGEYQSTIVLFTTPRLMRLSHQFHIKN